MLLLWSLTLQDKNVCYSNSLPLGLWKKKLEKIKNLKKITSSTGVFSSRHFYSRCSSMNCLVSGNSVDNSFNTSRVIQSFLFPFVLFLFYWLVH